MYFIQVLGIGVFPFNFIEKSDGVTSIATSIIQYPMKIFIHPYSSETQQLVIRAGIKVHFQRTSTLI